MVDQSKAFGAFARQAVRSSAPAYDVVVATSSRLMTAVLGAYIARRTGSRLYLDIRDIFVENIEQVAPGLVVSLTRPVLSRLERWAIGRANRVNLVSRGFADYFSARYPSQRFSYFTNGIDADFTVDCRQPPGSLTTKRLTVLYAGNIGEGQGLHVVLPTLARRLAAHVDFQVVGDGGRKPALVSALAASGVSNVQLHPAVPRSTLAAMYRAADVLFLHLNAYDAFKRVLPSKIFEYAAVAKPIWAGVSGYAAEFIRSEIRNAAVFDPCDADGAVRSFGELAIEHTPRPEFVTKYSRASISRAMSQDILSLAQDSR
jgi:hypothetical protein